MVLFAAQDLQDANVRHARRVPDDAQRMARRVRVTDGLFPCFVGACACFGGALDGGEHRSGVAEVLSVGLVVDGAALAARLVDGVDAAHGGEVVVAGLAGLLGGEAVCGHPLGVCVLGGVHAGNNSYRAQGCQEEAA